MRYPAKHLYLSEGIISELTDIAERESVSLSEIARRALGEYIEQNQGSVCVLCDEPVTAEQISLGDALVADSGRRYHTDCIDSLRLEPRSEAEVRY